MNRKHTILIAVLVNASLLVVLFITALTTQQEVAASSSPQFVDSSPKIEPIQNNQPLFGDASDLTLREALASEPKTLPVAAVANPESLTMHPLPEKIAEPTPPKDLALAAENKQTFVPPVSAASEAPKYIEIAVKKGDSLDKLAKEYHTSVSELIKINRLPSSFLKVGQLLKVPSQKKTPSSPKPAVVAAKEEEAISYYTVKVGDNPWTIAMKHNMKVEELLRLNGLNEEKARKLKPGDRLRTKYTPGH